jgi:hypothetical protein
VRRPRPGDGPASGTSPVCADRARSSGHGTEDAGIRFAVLCPGDSDDHPVCRHVHHDRRATGRCVGAKVPREQGPSSLSEARRACDAWSTHRREGSVP